MQDREFKMNHPHDSEDSSDLKKDVVNEIKESRFKLADCPICGASTFKFRFLMADKYPVVTCENCQFVTLNPQPSNEDLAKIYSKDYYLLERTPAGEAHFQELKQKTADHYLDLITQYAPHTKGHLLEVGCGEGDFSKRAADRGYYVSAIEYNSNAVRVAQQKLGERGTVYCGEIDIFADKTAEFDVCVLSDVLEHVRNPKEFLAKVFKMLKPNGVLFVACPSLDSWSAKVQKNQWVEFKPEHLHYFSSKTLKSLLSQSHFSDFQEKAGIKTLSIDYVAGHFDKFPVPLLTTVSRALIKIIPDFLKRMPISLVASGTIILARKN